MSTKEYLKGLTLEQLEFAKKEAERLIGAIRAQEKVRLVVVDDGDSNVACFTEDQFHLAKKKVCELIMSDDFKIQNINHSHPRLRGHMVYESEVAEWMELNT